MAQKNKIALVTGGSSGIGKDICLRFAEKGIDVIFTYNTGDDKAREVIRQLEKAGCRAAAIQLDMENISGFQAFFKTLSLTLQERFNAIRFDYLINNAGIGLSAPFVSTTEEQFDKLLNIQFKGVYFLTQQAVSYLNDGGVIVNLSSRLAQSGTPNYSAYASMKGAVETLTRIEAKELSNRKIRVNAVAPGPVATGILGGVIKDNQQFRDMAAAMTALGRVGEPEDIGGVVAFLCSDDARWITGQRIEVSGGMNL